MLVVGACLLFVAVLPLVLTKRFGSQWRLCGQHVVRIPLLLFLGLGVTLGIQWTRSFDEPLLYRKPLVLQWKVDAGLEAVYEELEAFLAEEDYHVHASLVGTVRNRAEGDEVALYGLLGAEAASPFARWRMLHDGPHRTSPHLLVEVVGDLDRRACVVRVDAGAVRDGSFSKRDRWTVWLGSLERRLRALEG